MRRIIKSLWLFFLFFQLLFLGLFILIHSSLIVALGGSNPQIGTLSEMLYNVAGWFRGSIGKGLATLVLLNLPLLGISRLLLRANLALGRSINAAASSSSLGGVDRVLSFLEPFLPARTMNEVAGDLRERIALLHDQGVSPWKFRSYFALGVLFILLDASREALAFRRRKKG